jgi:hypothetical protein
MPQYAAGWRTEPPVSLPSAMRTGARRDRGGRAARRAARDAGGVERVERGAVRAVLVEEPIANSSMFVLPTTTAPARAQPCERRLERLT